MLSPSNRPRARAKTRQRPKLALLLSLLLLTTVAAAGCVQTTEVSRTPYGLGSYKVIPPAQPAPPPPKFDFWTPFRWIGNGIASLFAPPEKPESVEWRYVPPGSDKPVPIK